LSNERRLVPYTQWSWLLLQYKYNGLPLCRFYGISAIPKKNNEREQARANRSKRNSGLTDCQRGAAILKTAFTTKRKTTKPTNPGTSQRILPAYTAIQIDSKNKENHAPKKM